MEKKHNIPEATYEGYIWMSDQTEPDVLMGNKMPEFTLTDGENPFVAEAQLWDAAHNISISVRFADGRYHIATTSVTPSAADAVTYLPHRIKGVRGLKFQRIWTPIDDPLCEGMPALTLQNTVFIGFEK